VVALGRAVTYVWPGGNHESTDKAPAKVPGTPHTPKGNSKAICRRGLAGLRPNLALAILDVSETGIRLRVRESLEPRQEIEVGLEGLGHARPQINRAEVVWCVATADGDYCIGAQFQRRLNYPDLHTLARL
jgi:hypothetical protein